MKRTCLCLLSVGMLAVSSPDPAHAETSDGLETMWECPHADGSTVYTNQAHAGCQAMALKPLSIVPDVAAMPTSPRTTPDTVRPPDGRPSQDRPPQRAGPTVPDWAKDWYASLAPSGSAQEEVCSLYSEWMQLVLKTRGGMFFGSDPSYGGEITGRSQRGPSYSYYDNTRYLALSKLFGRGFIPIGCFEATQSRYQ